MAFLDSSFQGIDSDLNFWTGFLNGLPSARIYLEYTKKKIPFIFKKFDI